MKLNQTLKPLPSDPMKMPELPSRVSSILEHDNPGTSVPSAHRTPRLSVDQTRTVTTSGGGNVTSDGQAQRLNLRAGQQGITVTSGGGNVKTFNGDQMHAGALANLDQGTIVGTGGGLPVDVFPGNQNVSTPIVGVAKPLPIAVNRDGGTGKVRGISVPVMIR